MSRLLRLIPLALALLLASCAAPSPQLPAGELGKQFTYTVPGTWTGSSSEGGSTSAMVKVFRKDGTAEGVLYHKNRSTMGYNFVMPEIPFTSRWRVKGDVTECYDIKTEVPGLFKPGLVIRDRLVSVSRNKIVSRSEKTGELETLTRVGSR